MTAALDLTDYRLAATERMTRDGRAQFVGELLSEVEDLVASGMLFGADEYLTLVDYAAGRVIRRRCACTP